MANCGLCGVDVTFDMMQHYVPDFEGKKHRVCKQCALSAKDKALKYDPVSGTIVIVEKSEIEIRKKCNVCGKVFCYSPMDIDRNKKKQSQAIWSAVGSLGGAMSGHYAASAVQQSNVSNAVDGIVDYNKCPNCGSMDLRVISKEELATEMNHNGHQQIVSQISVADELKKYKELLDMGVITKEEFDEKKNEILHSASPIQQPTAPSHPVTQSVEPVQRAPIQSTETKKFRNLPSILFRIISVFGILFGLRDVYVYTRGFQSVYRGALEFMVGNEAYISALFAMLIWIIGSVFCGFLVGRTTANIQRNNRNR